MTPKPTLKEQWRDALTPHMVALVVMGVLWGAGMALALSDHIALRILGVGISGAVGYWNPQAGRGSSKKVASDIVEQVNADTDAPPGDTAP